MSKGLISLIAFAALALPGKAQVLERRAAVITGNPNEGKCTVQVMVDAAEIDLRGDHATLRNVWGQAPQFERFECTGVMPLNPDHFRFRSVEGRGRMELMRSPVDGRRL